MSLVSKCQVNALQGDACADNNEFLQNTSSFRYIEVTQTQRICRVIAEYWICFSFRSLRRWSSMWRCRWRQKTPCRIIPLQSFVSPRMMFHQPADQTVNGSCQGASTVCNSSADGDVLQLPTFSTAAKVRVIITFTLCAVSAVCNLAVLWAASNGGKRKSHVRILIMNLTVADLLVTFIVMPLDAAWNITVQWQAGDTACRLLMFLKLVAMYSCAFVTVVISLDRQSAILNPLGISEAKRKSKIMLTVAWTMSVILSLPQVRENTLSVCSATQASSNGLVIGGCLEHESCWLNTSDITGPWNVSQKSGVNTVPLRQT